MNPFDLFFFQRTKKKSFYTNGLNFRNLILSKL